MAGFRIFAFQISRFACNCHATWPSQSIRGSLQPSAARALLARSAASAWQLSKRGFLSLLGCALSSRFNNLPVAITFFRAEEQLSEHPGAPL